MKWFSSMYIIMNSSVIYLFMHISCKAVQIVFAQILVIQKSRKLTQQYVFKKENTLHMNKIILDEKPTMFKIFQICFPKTFILAVPGLKIILLLSKQRQVPSLCSILWGGGRRQNPRVNELPVP